MITITKEALATSYELKQQAAASCTTFLDLQGFDILVDFGKFRGNMLPTIPKGYIHYLCSQDSLNSKLKEVLELELARRILIPNSEANVITSKHTSYMSQSDLDQLKRLAPSDPAMPHDTLPF